MEFFKSNFASYIIVFLTGFLACLIMTKNSCVYIPKEYDVIDTGGWVEHNYDTIVQIVEKEVPVPYPVYKKISEIPQWVQDSLMNGKWSIQLDTVMLEDTVMIGLNHYEDSIRTEDYELKWQAETYGFLTSMVPQITIFKDSLVTYQPIVKLRKPTWVATTGISNTLNYKVGIGYKGWMIESEFQDKLKFNQIYLTKQWYF